MLSERWWFLGTSFALVRPPNAHTGKINAELRKLPTMAPESSYSSSERGSWVHTPVVFSSPEKPAYIYANTLKT